jgi:hypothetical protein
LPAGRFPASEVIVGVGEAAAELRGDGTHP